MIFNLLVISLVTAAVGFVTVMIQTTPEQQPVKVRTEEPLRKRQSR